MARYQTCLLVRVRRADRVADDGGSKSKGEDIAVLHLHLDEAPAMIDGGKIREGKR